VGFYAKLAVLQAVVSTNVALYIWLAMFAVVFSLVDAYYYLRVIKIMYFDQPTGEAPATVRSMGVRLVLAVNAAAVLILGVLPSGLLDLCSRLIH